MTTSRSGMTLVEVLLAAMILGLGMMAIFTCLTRCLRLIQASRDVQKMQLAFDRGNLAHPMADIQSAIENVGNVEVARLEKGLPYLATIAGGAPMIGFLGTVIGMVQAFFNMAQAGNNVDISLLSGGIYTAMITTVGGLIVGIIAYFGYNFLSARISNIVFQMERSTIEFMDMVSAPAKTEKEI